MVRNKQARRLWKQLAPAPEQTGRTLSGTAYTLSHDYDGQLTQIAQGGTTVSFAYDALGRRYSRTPGGLTPGLLLLKGGGIRR